MNGKGMKAIPILVMFALMIGAFAPAAFAATDFTLDWSGSGTVTGVFNSGDDATAWVLAHGATSGTFYALDTGVCPYAGYHVDDSSAYIRGDIIAGGDLTFQYYRTDSYVPMYGISGQLSYSFVGSTGTGSLDFKTSSNYASLVSSEYSFQANGQFQATGTTFEIDHALFSGDPLNFGQLKIVGSGSAVVDYMADGYTGGDGFKFGSGDGCYTNADILATGSGWAQVWGHGDSSLSAYDGSWTLPLGGSVSTLWTYTSGLSVTNYAFQGS
jgi:hypothetical protein